MKNANLSPTLAWNILGVFGVVSCLGAAVFFGLEPIHTAPAASSTPFLGTALDRATAMTAEAKQVLGAKSWNLDQNALGGLVLSQLSNLALKHQVAVNDFRMDKATVVEGQTEAPYTMVIEGDFNHVMEMVQAIEAPGNKISLNLLQVASSDQGAGSVKATLGLTAFLRSST